MSTQVQFIFLSNSLPTIPVDDPICNCDVGRIQRANVIQLILDRKGDVLFCFRGVKSHEQDLCFVRLVCWYDGDQLHTGWLIKVFQQLLQLLNTDTHTKIQSLRYR